MTSDSLKDQTANLGRRPIRLRSDLHDIGKQTMTPYALVVTDDPTNKELDYLVPPQWESKVHVGSRVEVPLRSRNSLATIVELVDESAAPGIKNLAVLVSEEPVL